MDISWGKEAIDALLKLYGARLPDGLADKIRGKKASEIYKILPADAFQKHFDDYYSHFFAAPMAQILGPGKAIKSCPAFVAPASDNLGRTIYVKESSTTGKGTFYHEFIHYLQHWRFYPDFYCVGGKNPCILEGITEYLTRAAGTKVRKDRERTRSYEKYFLEIDSWVGGGKGRLEVLYKLNFDGTKDGQIEALGGAFPLYA